MTSDSPMLNRPKLDLRTQKPRPQWLGGRVRLAIGALMAVVVAGCVPDPGYMFTQGMGGQVGINNPDATYVTMIQEQLSNCPFCDLPHTGYYDQATTDAVANFQRAHSLVVTGAVNGATWTKLFYDGYGEYIRPMALYGEGYSTEYTGQNCTPVPSSWQGGSGIYINDYPGIALNHGELGHLYLVQFRDHYTNAFVKQGLLPMIDGMGSNESTVDVNLPAFGELGIPCNNYNVTVWGPL